MAEAVGLVSGILTLAIAAFQSCQTVCSTIHKIRDAPDHLRRLTDDLRDFYSILGTLESIVSKEERSSSGAEWPQNPGINFRLEDVLYSCLATFTDLNRIVIQYEEAGRRTVRSTWQRVKWTFKEDEVLDLRNALTAQKSTLNIAVSMANYYYLREVHESTSKLRDDAAHQVHEFEDELPSMLQNIEELRASLLPEAPEHRSPDRRGVQVDYKFALRHYLSGAASSLSGANFSAAATMQLSPLDDSINTNSTAFYSIRSRQAGRSTHATESCTKVYVKGIPGYRSQHIAVQASDRIDDLKQWVRVHISMPNAQFELRHGDSDLLDSDATISELAIPQKAQLSCVLFRPSKHAIRSEIPLVRMKFQDQHMDSCQIEGTSTDRLCDIMALFNRKVRYPAKREGFRYNDKDLSMDSKGTLSELFSIPHEPPADHSVSITYHTSSSPLASALKEDTPLTGIPTISEPATQESQTETKAPLKSLVGSIRSRSSPSRTSPDVEETPLPEFEDKNLFSKIRTSVRRTIRRRANSNGIR